MNERKWHFDLGDTTNGPVGFTGIIMANTKAQALQRLVSLLPDWVEVGAYVNHWEDPDFKEADPDTGLNTKAVEALQDLTVFFNPGFVKLEDIKLWEEK